MRARSARGARSRYVGGLDEGARGRLFGSFPTMQPRALFRGLLLASRRGAPCRRVARRHTMVLRERPELLTQTLRDAKMMAEGLDGVSSSLDRVVLDARRRVLLEVKHGRINAARLLQPSVTRTGHGGDNGENSSLLANYVCFPRHGVCHWNGAFGCGQHTLR